MKYYYGNSYKEAVSNKPVTINSTKVLRQYEENYNFVIPEDEVTGADGKYSICEVTIGSDYDEDELTDDDVEVVDYTDDIDEAIAMLDDLEDGIIRDNEIGEFISQQEIDNYLLHQDEMEDDD